MSKKKLEGIDLYGLLGLSINASLSDIRTAYRKKALKCHPDKNPDNPKAAELFVQLTEALEILLDESARAAYDKLLKAKEAAKLRHKELDEKRKKFKEDLEAREEAHFAKKEKQKSEEERLEEEISRLRKEGAKLVQDEIRLIQEEINKELENSRVVEDGSQYKIKVEWKVEENDELNGGYSEETLERIFKKYGDVTAIVVSPKCKGQALVEFKEKQAAELAMKIELGLMQNPLKLKWINKNLRPSKRDGKQTNSSLVTERDYESLVLRQMRQAEERKRLIEQMQKEEDGVPTYVCGGEKFVFNKMPVDINDFIDILAEICKDRNIVCTVKSSAKGAAIAGAFSGLGGLLLGPIGLAIGGAVGGVVAASVSENFISAPEILKNMSDKQKHILCNKVVYAFRNFGITDVTTAAALVLSRTSMKNIAIEEVLKYLTKDMGLQIRG